MAASRNPISKAERSLVFVCLLVVVPLASLVYLYGGRDAEPKWEFSPSPTLPTPNGYDFYITAAKATVRFKPEVDPASDVNAPSPRSSAYVLKNYSLRRRQQWLKANARLFALVDKGLTTPSLNPHFNSPNAHGDWPKLRQLSRDMSTRTRTLQMQKQPMRATMSALDGMQMAQDVMRGGGVTKRLVAMSIMTIGRTPLEDWNKTVNALNASEALLATRRLETIIGREPNIKQTLLADKREQLLELRRIFAVKNWRKSYNPQAFNTELGRTPLEIWQCQTLSKRAIYDNLSSAFDAIVAKCTLPYSQVLQKELPVNFDVFTRQFLWLEDRYVMNEARHATNNNMLLLRLALQAYIAEHGTAPSKLAALVPSYLKSIPTDVYNDGKLLSYRPQGKKYRLWSVGPDGINDGGVPLTSKRESGNLPVVNTIDNKGDFVAGLCR